MYKISIAGLELSITDPEERLRMGGPFTGIVTVNNVTILGDCVLENFVYKEDDKLLFFIKYHKVGNYQYFTINFYNLNNLRVYEFDREFEIIHIKQFITPVELEIFYAFHDQLPHLRSIFNLDSETFIEV
ncbi:hypothetical protein HQ865_18245 [Mucilaginibacter mali]|uniref:Uncharacterized protein n=1 Tax=Mucilaginibacter mali TaxID=2740462 RepID=A0A7D4PWC5_9SPHI|nr:hypothetical protein [Mucilaginibacter mali]QKJ31623.1 hypothetical protein HQ865_18245 [Mucilaginibacter mali]